MEVGPRRRRDSHLSCHRRLLLGQESVAGFVADVVFRPGVHVIHIHFVARQRRHYPNELPAVVEYAQPCSPAGDRRLYGGRGNLRYAVLFPRECGAQKR